MAKGLKYTTQFRKDLKKYKNKPEILEVLKKVLQYLQDEVIIPEIYRPHSLSGNYAGFMECHVKNDLLLIWFDDKTGEITLVRFGSHSELFK